VKLRLSRSTESPQRQAFNLGDGGTATISLRMLRPRTIGATWRGADVGQRVMTASERRLGASLRLYTILNRKGALLALSEQSSGRTGVIDFAQTLGLP
jgi:hypothetical protein